MFTVVEMLVNHVPGLILEANFQTGFSEQKLEPLVSKSDAILIHCFADKQTTIDRIKAREDDPDRHAGHFDQDALPTLFDLIDQDAYRLDLPSVPLIDVDTTNGHDPPIIEIVARLRHS